MSFTFTDNRRNEFLCTNCEKHPYTFNDVDERWMNETTACIGNEYQKDLDHAYPSVNKNVLRDKFDLVESTKYVIDLSYKTFCGFFKTKFCLGMLQYKSRVFSKKNIEFKKSTIVDILVKYTANKNMYGTFYEMFINEVKEVYPNLTSADSIRLYNYCFLITTFIMAVIDEEEHNASETEEKKRTEVKTAIKPKPEKKANKKEDNKTKIREKRKLIETN